MADAEILKRIDRHMERGNVLMERIDRRMEENSKVIEENSRVIRENHEVMRELMRRSEWFTQRVVGELKDLQDQTKAQTRAILQVLDRLQPSG